MQIIYFVWKTEVIEANHDGYCSGEENQETIYDEKLYCQYEVTKDQYYLLFWLNRECYEIFENELFIEATKPDIKIKKLGCEGSGYCDPSEHGLCHQKQKTPIKILKVTCDYKPKYNKWGKIKLKYKLKVKDSYPLRWLLTPMVEKNDMVYKCFNKRLPYDVINIICQMVFTL